MLVTQLRNYIMQATVGPIVNIIEVHDRNNLPVATLINSIQ